MDIKVEVISRETIKPSSPTPDHLRTHTLSLADQYAATDYVPVLFFYTATTTATSTTSADHSEIEHEDDDDGDYKEIEIKSQRLQKSLSQALSVFYPLAGRLRTDNLSVDCNDEGAHYSAARVLNCPRLSDFVRHPRDEDLIRLFPPTVPTPLPHADTTAAAAATTAADPLLVVRANFFPCGGVAICSEFSHKLTDAASFFTFVKSWSTVALGSGTTNVVVPDFSAGSTRFPPIVGNPGMPKVFSYPEKLVSRRFVVGASNVSSIRAKAAGGGTGTVEKPPTRVESVTALFWKCAVAAASRRKGSSPYAVLMGPVNTRARLVPPLPQHCFGNIVGMLLAVFDDDDANYEKEITDLSAYVSRLREGVEESTDENMGIKVAKMKQVKELYLLSSWCRFPLYEVDFGWGKPTWVSWFPVGGAVGFFLIDTRDGDGVEVRVTLKEDDMALFECNEELLAFAAPNPSADL